MIVTYLSDELRVLECIGLLKPSKRKWNRRENKILNKGLAQARQPVVCVKDFICEAMRNKNLLQFTYHNLVRIVEPHLD
ncbi:MAG TPA: hypothetical protein DC047_17035 [Blastocatellia bacterium]|nr:hypothetical protein [Blastocatellia bacterium]